MTDHFDDRGRLRPHRPCNPQPRREILAQVVTPFTTPPAGDIVSKLGFRNPTRLLLLRHLRQHDGPGLLPHLKAVLSRASASLPFPSAWAINGVALIDYPTPFAVWSQTSGERYAVHLRWKAIEVIPSRMSSKRKGFLNQSLHPTI